MSLQLATGIDSLEFPEGTRELVEFAQDWKNSDIVKERELQWQQGIFDSSQRKPQIIFHSNSGNGAAGIHKMVMDYGVKLLNILSGLYQKPMILTSADLWHYMSPIDDKKRYSQNWHRDPLLKGKLPIKVMLWCEPITENHGPFQYITNTRPGERSWTPENSICYPSLELVESQVDAGDIVTCTSDENISLSIAETAGLHRGGNLKPGYTRLCGNWAFYEAPD